MHIVKVEVAFEVGSTAKVHSIRRKGMSDKDYKLICKALGINKASVSKEVDSWYESLKEL